MAHKTLVGGTAYNITGGKSVVSGTAYNISGGKTMVGGTGYNIPFSSRETGEVYAMLYSDGNMVFQYGNKIENGKSLSVSYTNFKDIIYTSESSIPWTNQEINVSNINFNVNYPFNSLAWWFYCFNYINNININILNLNSITNMYSTFSGCGSMRSQPFCGENVVNFSNAYAYCYKLAGPPVCGGKVTNMSQAYRSCSNFRGTPVCGNNVTNFIGAYHSCYNLTGSPVCGSKVTDMSQAYYDCSKLTGSPVCGNSVIRMRSAYFRCSNLTGSPVCGSKVTDMSYAYAYCSKLTGSPVCGNNVIHMEYAYQQCSNLTDSPVCGNNVTNLTGTYYGCSNLTGSPVCGSKVIEMGAAYGSCHKLIGPPACGPNVIDMSKAYMHCYNLTGSPVCGNNVTNMLQAYHNCYNLTGSPVCGSKVVDMGAAYFNCQKLFGNAYFYSNMVNNAGSCFGWKNNSRQLNIYVIKDSTTNTVIHYNNTKSLVGANITWTDAGSYQYNTAYNIYIYPVANVAAAAIANGDEEANANAGIIIDGGNTGGGSSGSANYAVESVSGASYGFALNSDGYYESGNKGQSNTAALCKVIFVADGISNVYFDCINYAESNYDYGLLSIADKTLTTDYTADTTNVFKSFKGSQSASVQTVDYGVLSAGEHFVYVKYRKDSSVNNNNDSLQFKVRFE